MKQLAYCLIYSALGVLNARAGDCDLVVIGPIRTVSKAMPLAEGMAVKDGRIAYIGKAGESRKRLSPGGTLIELAPGQSVLPGIVDAHIHMLDAGMKRRLCMMEEPSSREQVFQTVAEFAKKNPDFEWITGYGWPPSLFADGNPHKKDLDAIVPDRPVFLFADDGHSAWLNSKGLAILGITKDIDDPPLGRIERDPKTGEPAGVLREEAAFQAEDRLPQPTDQFMLDSLKEVQSYLHGLGITMIQDAYTSPRFLEIYSRAARSGDLTMKVVAAHVTNPALPASQVDALIKLRDRYTYGDLRANSAKILMDGIIEAKTAAVIEPYVGTNDHGILNWQAAEFAAMAQRLDKEGFQIHIHAVGDKAVRAGLDGLEAARKANGPSGNRHQMAHLELVDPEDMPRFQALDVTVNFQPYWLYEDVWLENNTLPYIGPERAKRLYQIKTLTDAGARLALGSDWPISSPDPFLGMMVAATHKNPKKPQYPSGSLRSVCQWKPSSKPTPSAELGSTVRMKTPARSSRARRRTLSSSIATSWPFHSPKSVRRRFSRPMWMASASFSARRARPPNPLPPAQAPAFPLPVPQTTDGKPPRHLQRRRQVRAQALTGKAGEDPCKTTGREDECASEHWKSGGGLSGAGWDFRDRVRSGRSSLESRRIRERVLELSDKHPRYGHRRIPALVRREGLEVNGKRVARIRRGQ